MNWFIPIHHYDPASNKTYLFHIQPDTIKVMRPITLEVPANIESPDGTQAVMEKPYTALVMSCGSRINAEETPEQIDKLIDDMIGCDLSSEE